MNYVCRTIGVVTAERQTVVLSAPIRPPDIGFVRFGDERHSYRLLKHDSKLGIAKLQLDTSVDLLAYEGRPFIIYMVDCLVTGKVVR